MVVRMRRAIGLTTISGIFAALLAAPTAAGAAAQVNTGIQTEAASAESGPADSELGRDTMPFQTASQQTSSSFWVLLSVWHHVEDNDLGRGPMGLKEEDDLQQWGTDYGRDLPSDREVEQFDDALFYIGDMLRHAQNDIGPGLAARDLTAGYLTLPQGGGPVEGQEDVRDAMQQDWEDAVSQLRSKTWRTTPKISSPLPVSGRCKDPAPGNAPPWPHPMRMTVIPMPVAALTLVSRSPASMSRLSSPPPSTPVFLRS